tara:strand:+ start:364 stop:576 length:213 start_codon:yes stop_codon:yes gene_type:complete
MCDVFVRVLLCAYFLTRKKREKEEKRRIKKQHFEKKADNKQTTLLTRLFIFFTRLVRKNGDGRLRCSAFA